MMTKPTCTITALVLGSISLVLTVGWFLNQQTSGDWFEESGFFVNLVVTTFAVAFAAAAFLRAEPKKLFTFAGLLLATPGILLCMRILITILITIGRFMYHRDT